MPETFAFREFNKTKLRLRLSVRHFLPYLYYQKFTIYTDHQPQTFLYNCKDYAARIIRCICMYYDVLLLRNACMSNLSILKTIDFCKPYLVCNNENKYMRTFIDALTKFVGAFVNKITPRFGIPEEVS